MRELFLPVKTFYSIDAISHELSEARCLLLPRVLGQPKLLCYPLALRTPKTVRLTSRSKSPSVFQPMDGPPSHPVNQIQNPPLMDRTILVGRGIPGYANVADRSPPTKTAPSSSSLAERCRCFLGIENRWGDSVCSLPTGRWPIDAYSRKVDPRCVHCAFRS